jgi:hypothetical protein
MQRWGAALMIAGSICVAWQLQRRAPARQAPPTSLARNCVEFHRSELERQGDALASVWRWNLAPIVPGLVVLYVAWTIERGIRWPITAALLALSAAVLLVIARLNHAAARRLQREIDALGAARE